MVYGTYNYSIHGVYKPSYNWDMLHFQTQPYGHGRDPPSACVVLPVELHVAICGAGHKGF